MAQNTNTNKIEIFRVCWKSCVISCLLYKMQGQKFIHFCDAMPVLRPFFTQYMSQQTPSATWWTCSKHVLRHIIPMHGTRNEI